MVDDHDTGPKPDSGRPKRPAPTLELTVAHASDRPSAADNAAPDPAAPPEPPEAPAEPVDTAPSDMPPFTPSEPAPERAPPRAASSWLLPAVSGAIAGALVSGALWYALGQEPANDKAETDALAGRIAQLEARPVAAPDAALAGRIDAVEKSLAALRGEVTAGKTQADRLAADLNQLKSAPRPAAAPDLGPLNERLGQVERASGELKAAIAQQSARPMDDTALRRVLAASLLDGAVRQGEPYEAALATARPLAGDAARLQPLQPFAATGVPGAPALCRELLAVLPRLTPAADPAASSGGFLDRLQAGAARLVRVERTDGGGDGQGSAARAGAAARAGDLAAARQALLALPAADRAVVQPWLDRVAARDAALAASRQFAADAMTALSKPAP